MSGYQSPIEVEPGAGQQEKTGFKFLGGSDRAAASIWSIYLSNALTGPYINEADDLFQKMWNVLKCVRDMQRVKDIFLEKIHAHFYFSSSGEILQHERMEGERVITANTPVKNGRCCVILVNRRLSRSSLELLSHRIGPKQEYKWAGNRATTCSGVFDSLPAPHSHLSISACSPECVTHLSSAINTMLGRYSDDRTL